ncbi:UNVERIFIED_CONTAM: hypothetical protein Slati_4527400 [Sesamum latifolium]|uniref:Uncharacterized protein n=1 Tax=Sesamum latifolium TaxID=2727402 RepID=A0AAW2SH95_9LAMI
MVLTILVVECSVVKWEAIDLCRQPPVVIHRTLATEAPAMGYIGNSNSAYSAYGGYGVGAYGSANSGYTSPAGVYGSASSPNTNSPKNQWRSQTGGYGASGYNQTPSYGASVPWRNPSRSSPGGYGPAGRYLQVVLLDTLIKGRPDASGIQMLEIRGQDRCI